ncbi:MAG: lipopolysaccharide heptosyltransferase I [Pseudomonadales bacterium]|nr:lipopolysaccharide heptosyltransferase I [Pseudomonadales bacterium]
MRILIVKLSSMGDLVQALPAISDIAQHYPNAIIDWVVDEGFAEVPAWHFAINQVIPTAHRRWKRRIWQSLVSGDIRQTLKQIRRQQYDVVLDLQGNLKSALVTRIAKGKRIGADKASVREKPAYLAYDVAISAPRNQLAIERLRHLCADAFGYTVTGDINFGLTALHADALSIALPDKPFLVFVTNASWATKCLPEQHWRLLLAQANEQGYQVLMPWGSQSEQQRCLRLAAGLDYATVLPRLSLSALAVLLQHSEGAICNDTGLAHIAAALAKPTVTVYGPTDPALIAATGPHAMQMTSAELIDCQPCYRRSCAKNNAQSQPLCLAELKVETIWQQFIAQL